MAAIPGTSANDSDRVHKVSSEAGKAAAGVCQKLPERRKKRTGKILNAFVPILWKMD